MNSREIEKLMKDFKDYLLSTEISDNIAKIILFSSHAKGTGRPDSDLDLFVFTTNGMEVENALIYKANRRNANRIANKMLP